MHKWFYENACALIFQERNIISWVIINWFRLQQYFIDYIQSLYKKDFKKTNYMIDHVFKRVFEIIYIAY